MLDLGQAIMRGFALGFGLPEGYFAPQYARSFWCMRVIRSVSPSVFACTATLGAFWFCVRGGVVDVVGALWVVVAFSDWFIYRLAGRLAWRPAASSSPLL